MRLSPGVNPSTDFGEGIADDCVAGRCPNDVAENETINRISPRYVVTRWLCIPEVPFDRIEQDSRESYGAGV